MSTFHEEIAHRVSRHLQEHRLVVLYDPRREFEPFVQDLLAGGEGDPDVQVGECRAWIARFGGSYLALRHEVERRVAQGEPRCGLVYVGGEEQERSMSPLMEYDLAGHGYQPQLRRTARDILRERFSDGQIDALLEPAGIGYRDIAAYFDQDEGESSALRLIFGSIGSEAMLARWILEANHDAEVQEKGAVAELRALAQARVGLALAESISLATARRDLLRYVLVNEFRLDLGGSAPDALDMVPQPSQGEQRERIRAVAAEMRRRDPARYEQLADGVESDLGLQKLTIAASELGAIDTFRFEEQRLLEEAARQLATGAHDIALALAQGREDSHWVRTDARRLAQWSVLWEAATLAKCVVAYRKELAGFAKRTPREWIERYTAADGWCTIDGMDRRLGAKLSAMDEEPVAAVAIRKVRREYADWVRLASESFTPALVRAEWDTGWPLHQTAIFDGRVDATRRPMAFLVVDALRYEMAQELAQRLERSASVALEPAVAALPTITSVGMAALLPGASQSFSVRGDSGISGAIGGELLPDWAARWKHLQARVPGAVELRLEKLLQMTEQALAECVGGAQLVLVRSQDIDAVGEANVGLVAQQAMATVIPNLARAIHRLSAAGIRDFVVAADHGHLLDETQDDDMKIETPGGDTVELHRRCWVGRGGKTPAGAVRVPGANLGYDTDLDFVFPAGRGVFLSGGGLRYHHGGLSLQEMVVPVLTIRMEQATAGVESEARVKLLEVPERITNRTVGVRIKLASDLFAEPHAVRVVLLDQAQQVGEAGMAQGAAMDPKTRRIELIPGKAAMIGLMLSRDDCREVRLVVLDAETEAVLAQSKPLKVNLSI